jgi:hypothetical protein
LFREHFTSSEHFTFTVPSRVTFDLKAKYLKARAFLKANIQVVCLSPTQPGGGGCYLSRFAPGCEERFWG